MASNNKNATGPSLTSVYRTIAAKPSRPTLRYHGGKWRLAPWVVSHFPPHRIYVEPFGGAASVLLLKPRAYAEIYNDLDEEIVSLFRVLRDPRHAAALQRMVELTPFARSEFDASYESSEDPVEQARRTLVRSWMGQGSSGLRGHKTGFRANPDREHSTAMDNWVTWPNVIPAIVARLRGVAIERRPALELIEIHDRPDRLLYLDPPYLFETRSQKRKGNDLYHGYRHELTDEDHCELLARVLVSSAMIIISGYSAPLYERALSSWRRFEKHTVADKAKPRIEVLWLNPACADALDRLGRTSHAQQLEMLGAVGA